MKKRAEYSSKGDASLLERALVEVVDELGALLRKARGALADFRRNGSPGRLTLDLGPRLRKELSKGRVSKRQK